MYYVLDFSVTRVYICKEHQRNKNVITNYTTQKMSNNRNFRVAGNITCLYKVGSTTQNQSIENIEVQLWHKAPLTVIFLGKAVTDAVGNFVIDFNRESPVNYIADGKITEVFMKAYYKGQSLLPD